MDGTISNVAAGSLAEELELAAGDKILAVNGHKITDIIDLSFQLAEEEIELLVEHADGEREIIAGAVKDGDTVEIDFDGKQFNFNAKTVTLEK